MVRRLQRGATSSRVADVLPTAVHSRPIIHRRVSGLMGATPLYDQVNSHWSRHRNESVRIWDRLRLREDGVNRMSREWLHFNRQPATRRSPARLPHSHGGTV